MDYCERSIVLTQVIAPTGSYQFNKVKSALTTLRDTLVAQKAKRDLLEKQRITAVQAKEDAETQLGIFDKVQILLQKTSDYARRQAKERIEAIVSEALNVVFGGSHRFAIELSLKSNQPVAEYFLNDGTVITRLDKPDYDRGGGKIDIITLALRLAIGEMEGIQGPLFLDEVGKHISKEYTANVAYFLKEYGVQFDRQIVLITHNSDLAEIGDLGLTVICRNGVSEVTTI
jgi:hypothetical protein